MGLRLDVLRVIEVSSKDQIGAGSWTLESVIFYYSIPLLLHLPFINGHFCLFCSFFLLSSPSMLNWYLSDIHEAVESFGLEQHG